MEEEPKSKKPPNYVWFLIGMVVVLLAIVIAVFVIVIKMVKAS